MITRNDINSQKIKEIIVTYLIIVKKAIVIDNCDKSDKLKMTFPDTEGDSSSNACHQNYRGPTPLSDPESLSIKEFIFKNRKTIKLFISLHSYGQVRKLLDFSVLIIE